MILMENLTHIQIFKTNIQADDKMLLKVFLDNNSAIEEWSVDCEDIDCVLRVVSYELSADEIIKLVNEAGFECQELF